MPTARKWVSDSLTVLTVVLFWWAILECSLRFLQGPIHDEFLNQSYNLQHPTTHRVFGPHPVLGKWNLPNAEGLQQRMEYRTRIKINSKGLRGPEKEYGKPQDKKRILFLGDSFTFGTGVEQDESFVWRIQKLADPKLDIINGGAPGSSTNEEFRFLSSEGFRYAPDGVVLVFFQNDIQDNYGDALEASGAAKRRNPATLFYKALAKASGILEERLYGRSAVYAAVSYWKRNFLESYQVSKKEFAVTHRQLEKIRGFCAANGYPLALVYLPRREELKKTGNGLGSEWLADYCGKNNLPLLNLWEKFRARKDTKLLYFQFDTHLTPYGHEVTAQLILDFFRAVGILPAA